MHRQSILSFLSFVFAVNAHSVLQAAELDDKLSVIKTKYGVIGMSVGIVKGSELVYAFTPGRRDIGRNAHNCLSATGIYFLQICSNSGFSSARKLLFLH